MTRERERLSNQNKALVGEAAWKRCKRNIFKVNSRPNALAISRRKMSGQEHSHRINDLQDKRVLKTDFEYEHSETKGRYTMDSMITNTKKVRLGQFFTRGSAWLRPQVKRFLLKAGVAEKGVIDPFAGAGDLLRAMESLGCDDRLGLDIDPSLGWDLNDSLRQVPKTGRVVMTNPPYLAKNSASRRKIGTAGQFNGGGHTDLYQIAVERCLESHDWVVAILPESFVMSRLFLDRLSEVSIIEKNPFLDTMHPVCVACFSPSSTDAFVYKNDNLIGTLSDIKNQTLLPTRNVSIRFNVPNGNVGLRCLDGVGPGDRMRFCAPSEIGRRPAEITQKSRHISIVSVDVQGALIDYVVAEANDILERYRQSVSDVLLSPFKNNTSENKHRRRLDFKTARAILELAVRCCSEEIKRRELLAA